MQPLQLNLEARQNLSNLILTITKTGDLYLDPEQVKQVKSICKKSDANVKVTYELLMIQLQRKHAQIRYSSTQLIAELFQRSHVFRELLVADYSIFLQLTVGIHQNILPPPILFAEKTKQLAISLTNEWNAKYGAVYKQIALGYEFLRYHLKVDFTDLVPVTEEARSAEQRAQEEMSKRLRQKRYEKVASEMEEKAEDIQDNLRKMDSCFDILVPKLDDEAALNAVFDASAGSNHDDVSVDAEEMENEEDEREDSDADAEAPMRHDPLGVFENALGSNRYKLTINVNKDNPVDVEESEENSEVFTTLRECYRLIVKKHWPMVMEWLDVLMKADRESGERRQEYDRLLRSAIDLKKGVADAKSKSEDLGVNMDTMYGPHGNDSDEDDEEFEQVDISATSADKKKGKQPKKDTHKLAPLKPANPIFVMHGAEILEDDPTYVGGTRTTAARMAEKSATAKGDSSSATAGSATDESSTSTADGEESRQALLARAPVVPWDDDLALWDKKEMAFNTSGLEFSHRFLGVGDGSNLVSQATLDRMKMRTRIYNPELPKVIKACRFPMSNGKLCMRRDLVRCPYHGPVIPRDEFGQIQLPPEEGGFIQEENMLDDAEEADLINRAVAAASSSSSTSGTRSSSRLQKDTTTWEDIEDDVHQALGLQKIEPKRKRGQAGGAASKKKKKPASALINISKPPDSARSRLLKRVTSKASKDSVAQDQRGEQSELSRDSRLNRSSLLLPMTPDPDPLFETFGYPLKLKTSHHLTKLETLQGPDHTATTVSWQEIKAVNGTNGLHSLKQSNNSAAHNSVAKRTRVIINNSGTTSSETDGQDPTLGGHDFINVDGSPNPLVFKIDRLSTPDRGRIMVAASFIPMGTFLFAVSAQATVCDSDNRKRRCASCFSSLLSTKGAPAECKGCNEIWYCHHESHSDEYRDCRLQDWEVIHQYECGFLKRMYQGHDAVSTHSTIRLQKHHQDAVDRFRHMEHFEQDYCRVLIRTLIHRFKEYSQGPTQLPLRNSSNQSRKREHKDQSELEADAPPEEQGPLPFQDVVDLVENRSSFPKSKIEGDMMDVARILDAFQEYLHQDQKHRLQKDPSLDKEHPVLPLSVDELLGLILKEECNSFGLYEYPSVPAEQTVISNDFITPASSAQKELTTKKTCYALGLFVRRFLYSFNHSCSPNLYHLAHNSQLLVYAGRDIAHGEELNISYMEFGPKHRVPPREERGPEGEHIRKEALAARRQYLRDIFHFDCMCARCTWELSLEHGETEVEDAFLRLGLMCGRDGCYGFYAPPIVLEQMRDQEVMTTDTPFTKLGGKWCTIESSPAVFNALMRENDIRGVHVKYIFSLDRMSFEFLESQGPVYGFIFLLKPQGSRLSRAEELSENVDTSNVFFANQVIPDACGTQALLSIVLNCPQVDIGPMLKNFKEFTAAFDPLNKGLALTNCQALRENHNKFAGHFEQYPTIPLSILEADKKSESKDKKKRQQKQQKDKKGQKGQKGQKRPTTTKRKQQQQEEEEEKESGEQEPGLTESDAFHYIAYVYIDGYVWELDGLQARPERLKACGAEDWVEEARLQLATRMKSYDQEEEGFVVLALVKDPILVQEERLAESKTSSKAANDNKTREKILDMEKEIRSLRRERQVEEMESAEMQADYTPAIEAFLKGYLALGESTFGSTPKTKRLKK
ncbi:hypothetical protein BGZ50_002480 [Haplosporangium sp. Z 11]|nr:hypothetical protein BGZ50_002480 [Haplosporangium sp. Z 11]